MCLKPDDDAIVEVDLVIQRSAAKHQVAATRISNKFRLDAELLQMNEDFLGLSHRTTMIFLTLHYQCRRGGIANMRVWASFHDALSLRRIEDIFHDFVAAHQQVSKAESTQLTRTYLRELGLPEKVMAAYPHQLSGGMRQRIVIAIALACRPQLLIADEPTTALDVTIQAEILELMASLQKRLGMGMIFITHDLNIVRRIAHRVYVMRQGEVVEEGETKALFANPKHEYTRALLASEPTGRKAPVSPNAPKILDGTDLRVNFKIGGGFLSGEPIVLRAVDRVCIFEHGRVRETLFGNEITVERAVLGLFFSGVKLSDGHGGLCFTPIKEIPDAVCCPSSARAMPLSGRLGGRSVREYLEDISSGNVLKKALGIATVGDQPLYEH